MTPHPEPRPTNGAAFGRRNRGFWRKAAAAVPRPPGPDTQAAGAQSPTAPLHPAAFALAALEEALVAQLRLAQSLDALTEQERLALTTDAPATLAEVVRAKLTCTGELARLEIERDRALAAWAEAAGLRPDTTFEELLPRVETAVAERLSLYRLGIEAHLEHCRALRPANRALARAAVARPHVWRRFLLRQAAGGGAWPAEAALKG
jgi:hypothetical protein